MTGILIFEANIPAMLTDAKVRNLKPKEKMYRILDADRLYIEVKPKGTKFWRYKFTINGVESILSLGQYPMITLLRARELHAEARKLVAEGINPVDHRKNEKLKKQNENKNTFEVIVNEWKEKKLEGKSESYIRNVNSGLTKDILPVIGQKVAKEVNSADVLLIINNTIKRVSSQGNFGTGETVAINNRQIISAVMRYAIATLRAEYDPTYAVKDAIDKPDVNHAQPLNKLEIKKLKIALQDYGGTSTVKNAVNFLFYTMLRTIEVRRSKWDHVNFEDGTITFASVSRKKIKDGERLMKMNRTHVVPLPTQALAILKEQYEISGLSEYIFPSPYTPKNMLSITTINRVFEYLKVSNITAHDFRATASTTLNEAGFNPDWIELQLAHSSDDKTRASYNHAKYLSDRREMLQWWADYLDSLAK